MNAVLHAARWRLGLSCLLCLLGACSADSESTGPSIDPRFDQWCGDRPCDWDLMLLNVAEDWQSEGAVERVGTWHPNDYGVALVAEELELSQLIPEVDDVTCFEFKLIADFDDDVEVRLQLDFYDDGTLEFDEAMPDADWQPLSFLITPPYVYHGVRFIIHKSGSGRAVLSRLYAGPGLGCRDDPLPIDRPPALQSFP